MYCIRIHVSDDVRLVRWLKVWVKQTKSDFNTGHCLQQSLGGGRHIFISHHKYFEAGGRHPPVTAEFSPRGLRTLKRPESLQREIRVKDSL